MSFRLPLVLLCSAAAAQTVRIPPITNRIAIEGQSFDVTVSGTLAPQAEGVAIALDADLAGLQRHIYPLLRAQLNQAPKCGDRISVESASLAPSNETVLLTAGIHFEKWGCAKVFGKEVTKRVLAGNGTVVVRLIPEVQEGKSVRLAADVVSVDAEGPLGDLLRSGSAGAALQEKIRTTLATQLDQATGLSATVPAPLRDVVTIHSAVFHASSGGTLALALKGQAQLPPDAAKALIESLAAAR